MTVGKDEMQICIFFKSGDYLEIERGRKLCRNVLELPTWRFYKKKGITHEDVVETQEISEDLI